MPRHFERCRELGQKLAARDVKFFWRSEYSKKTEVSDGELECLLVNTTGELRFFYEHATVVFVGKSLTAIGGQNPIEPGALGKAMVFGPNMQNFADATRSFVTQNGALQVNDAAELGRNALKVVAENHGALERTVEMILEQLRERGIYVAPGR